MRSFKEFVALGTEAAIGKEFQDLSYFETHSIRFYNTYVFCAKLINATTNKLISFGAGSAYVEHALAKWHDAQVTIVDFPEAIAQLKPFYDQCGFQVIAGDLSQDFVPPQQHYDIALSSEVIEHIPRPPAEHVQLLASTVKIGGHVIVTTPNFANIRTIARLLFMKPVLPAPERTFGPVCFENQSVHRREYLPSEIIDAFRANGVRHLETEFTENHPERRIALALAVKSIPRFRATMMLHGNRMPA